MTLHERIAKALGWSVADAQSFSLLTLRDMLRASGKPKLAAEVSQRLTSGGHGRSNSLVVTHPSGPGEETTVPAVRLEDLRYGWRLWCRLGDIDDCTNTDQRRGFRLAAEANDRGGNRPTVAEARHLDINDLQEIN